MVKKRKKNVTGPILYAGVYRYAVIFNLHRPYSGLPNKTVIECWLVNREYFKSGLKEWLMTIALREAVYAAV